METQLIKGNRLNVITSFCLASVGVISPVVDLLLGLAIGLANGLSIIIAQKIGSKQRTEVKKAMINGLYIMIVLGLSITCIGLMIQSTLFQWMNVLKSYYQELLVMTVLFLLGALFSALYNYESALLRAYGDSVTPLLFLIFQQY